MGRKPGRPKKELDLDYVIISADERDDSAHPEPHASVEDAMQNLVEDAQEGNLCEGETWYIMKIVKVVHACTKESIIIKDAHADNCGECGDHES